MSVSIWDAVHSHSVDRWALSGADVQAPWHGARDSVAPLRRNSAGWMPATIGRFPLVENAGTQPPFARRRWWQGEWAGVSSATPDRSRYVAVECTKAKVAVRNVVAAQPGPCSRLKSRGVSFMRSDSWCRRYVSVPYNVTQRYLG